MKTAEKILESDFDWFDKSPGGEKLYFESTTIRAMESYATLRVKEAIDNQEKWVSVEERLPEEDVVVFVATQVGGTAQCFYKNGFWRYQNTSKLLDHVLNVTHWMPLPSPPKQ